jgi:ArsR family transcriptional regulator, lead/cadmium/zinc/bismuth-responsive transcriptional repressor
MSQLSDARGGGATDSVLCASRCVHPDAVARARSGLTDEPSYTRLAALFSAVADPTRAKIVHMLLGQELCTCDVAVVLGITDSAVSQHLRVLRSLRLVKARREGKFVYYTLDDAHIALLIQVGLTHQSHGAGESTISGSVRATAER